MSPVALRTALATIAAILFALVTGCGGGDENVETSEWAESVCAGLVDWRSSIEALADVDAGELTAESLGNRLAEAAAATRTLVTELGELGPPEVEAGDEVREALRDAAAGIERQYEALGTAAEEALEAKTRAALFEALARLGDDFQSLVDQPAEVVATLQSASLFGGSSAELEQAFAAAESCEPLRGES